MVTKTIREELASVASSCEEALEEQSRLEEFLAKDFRAIDHLIKGLDNKRGNATFTVEDARDLALQLRQAISWNEVNAQGIHLLFLLMLQVSLLVQQDSDMKIDVSANIEAFQKWFNLWERAKGSWDKYIEEEASRPAR
jgi:hypothetical protein